MMDLPKTMRPFKKCIKNISFFQSHYLLVFQDKFSHPITFFPSPKPPPRRRPLKTDAGDIYIIELSDNNVTIQSRVVKN